jgi:hypothetical protein
VTRPGKSHPPDCKVPFFKTPEELCADLARLRHYVTERQLTDWRRKKLLPDLTRQGVANGWTDPDIVLRAHTLCVMLRHRRRTDGGLLLTWFAGSITPKPTFARFGYNRRRLAGARPWSPWSMDLSKTTTSSWS